MNCEQITNILNLHPELINSKNDHGQTALHVAIEEGKERTFLNLSLSLVVVCPSK